VIVHPKDSSGTIATFCYVVARDFVAYVEMRSCKKEKKSYRAYLQIKSHSRQSATFQQKTDAVSCTQNVEIEFGDVRQGGNAKEVALRKGKREHRPPYPVHCAALSEVLTVTAKERQLADSRAPLGDCSHTEHNGFIIFGICWHKYVSYKIFNCLLLRIVLYFDIIVWCIRRQGNCTARRSERLLWI
jgi:hypothetical protein